jgi:hypothetical protein
MDGVLRNPAWFCQAGKVILAALEVLLCIGVRHT